MPFRSISRLVIASICCTLAFGASFSQAALIHLDFTGGSGTNISMTFGQPISYTVTHDTPTPGFLFVFLNVGHLVNLAEGVASSTTYTVNGGSLNNVNTAYTGAGPFQSTTDLALFRIGLATNLKLGDVVLLTAGTTTINNTSGVTAPLSGDYDTILTDGNGVQLNPVAVPEPTMLSLFTISSLALLRRRRYRG